MLLQGQRGRLSSKCTHSTCSEDLNFYWNFMLFFAFIRSLSCRNYTLTFLTRRWLYFMIKKLNISTSRLYKVTKSAISSQQKRDLLWNSKFNPIHGRGGVNLTQRFQIFLALLNRYTCTVLKLLDFSLTSETKIFEIF